MNILMFFPYWHYDELAKEYLSYFSRRGHAIVVLRTSNKSKEVSSDSDGRLKIYGLPYLDLSLGGLVNEKYPIFVGLENLIKNIQFELSVVYIPLFLTSAQAIRAVKKLNKPVVLEVQGVYAQRNSLHLLGQKIYLHTIGRWIFKNSDFIRCASYHDLRELMRFGCDISKVKIIPNPVDVHFFKPSTEREHNTLIWSGRLVAEKGLDYLIKAMHMLVNDYKKRDVKLNLLGDGPRASYLATLVKRFQLQKNVIFWGRVSRKQVAHQLSKASIFTFPSIREGMPLSVLEAFSSGLPVVGFKVPGVEGVVVHGYNGMLVQARNVKALADTILFLLENHSLREQLGKNARENAVSNYSFERIIPRLESLYMEASNSNG